MSLRFLTPDPLQLFTPDCSDPIEIPIADAGVSAGIPSPANSYEMSKISLDHTLVGNSSSTFYAKVSGQSMIGAGLDDGDLLVVDKGIRPHNGQIAVCFIDGEFTVKRLMVTSEGMYLQPENPNFQPLLVTETNNFQIWGVVTHVIKKL